jgi:hypothetical protein
LEEFERAINSRTTNINLDLNNDNQVDYISVFSYDQGQFHSIVLRVVSSSEYQDVAVIEVSKTIRVELLCRSLEMKLCMVEVILWNRPIAVPNQTQLTQDRGQLLSGTITMQNTVVFVDSWPLVAYLFSPLFSVYISPWNWGYYLDITFGHPPILYYGVFIIIITEVRIIEE